MSAGESPRAVASSTETGTAMPTGSQRSAVRPTKRRRARSGVQDGGHSG